MSVSKIDVKIQFPEQAPWTYSPGVASGGTPPAINAGEPTKQSSANVATMVDADGTTSQVFTGIAKASSTETATVAGNVTLYSPLPGIVYAALAKTASLANTAALIAALTFKRVIWDKASSTFTVDTAAGDSASANGLLIVGGEYQTSTIWFNIRVATSIYNNLTT